ncbi:MAG: chlorite dismutase family protein [Acidimicrobiales bacterium]
MPEPLSPVSGWGVLHLFCHLRGSAGAMSQVDIEAVVGAVKACEADEHQVVSFAVLGHKADLGFMALGPDLWRLRRFQGQLQRAGLVVTSSYVSLTETSEYAKDLPPEMVSPRLHPQLPPPGMRAVCFYGMSKRRDPGVNWYATPFEDRKRMMYEHGTSGRAFRGRVLQLVTGSTGIDDWEWGVTLFAADPADLKEVVYTLRFDEASARFGEFGPFYTGIVAEVDEVLAEVMGTT